MSEEIEHPKVFISYAWNDKEYQDKVMSFANSLIKCGIEVILDKYDLKEGQNIYAFMEKSVSDTSVTNVLLLIDPTYEQKANSRQGGVGTETQIISPEVYEKVEQTKFLPIIFGRDPTGRIPKPNYLKSTLYFDLSSLDMYDDEFRRLVKRLYGFDDHRKPQLGEKPSWIEEEIEPKEFIRITKYEEIKNIVNIVDRGVRFKEEFNNLKHELISYSPDKNDCLSVYNEMQSIKKDTLALIKLIPYVPKSINVIAEIYEAIANEFFKNHTIPAKIKLSLLHELFLYTVAFCLKNDLYDCISYLLNHSYYSNNNLSNLESFKIFYSYNENLNNAMNLKDNKKYHSGTAQYWMDTLESEFCSKEEFIYADIFCYNISLFNKNCYWFPLTYVYDIGNYRSLIRKFSVGLKSSERLESVVKVFGCNTISDFVDAFERNSTDNEIRERINATRYPSAFESPENIFDIIKFNELDSMK
jgi:hypothetical protein